LVEIPSDLIEACRRGDAQAFEALVRATQQRVYSLAFRIVGNHEDASDVAQEVYVKVWRAIRHYRGDSAFTTWLHRVATNAAIEHLRKRGRLAEPIEPERMAQMEQPAPEREIVVEQSDVEAALERLPAAYRVALVMRELYGMSMEEVAKQLGSSVGATKVRLHRARQRLAEELEKSGTVIPIRREKKSS
jgi:RNA polymerase sigma-70 factor (ECF subfamily)